jgi:hypothetical protein
MPKPFDATLKDLVQSHLPDYVRQFELTELGPFAPLNVDLSTISAATDIVLGHGDPPKTIVDLNFQASHDNDLASRVFVYNALLHHRFRAPVHSVVVLLRPEADDRRLTGRLRYQIRSLRSSVRFAYAVVKVWQLPADRLLEGGLGIMPLATLGKFAGGVSVEAGLAQIARQIVDRLSRQASPAVAAKLLTASYVLSGLRVPEEVAKMVFEGVQAMKESTTYQGIVAEGRVDEARRIILRQGKKKFGRPSAAVMAALENTSDLDRLERLSDRVLIASSWRELLDVEQD